MKTLTNFISNIIACLDQLIPSQNNLIGFTGIKGRTYSDNTKHLFNHLLKFHSENVQLIWFVKEKSLIQKIKEETPNAHVVYLHSIKGVWFFVRTNILVITHGSYDFRKFPVERKLVVNLWHGIPLKTLRKKVKKYHVDGIESTLVEKPVLSDSDNYDILIGSSDEEVKLLSECFDITTNRIYSTGMPRTDFLFKGQYNTGNHNQYPFFKGNTILYAPTFREDDVQVQLFPFKDVNLNTINDFLIETGSWIIIRGHGFDGDIYKDIKINCNRMKIADQDLFPDANELLPFVDMLITDYSSIYFDYLILDRPIMYLPYDLKDYERVRGFLHDYDEVTPGPKVYNQRDFMDMITKFLENPSWYGEKRKDVRDRFFKHQDGNACDRIFNLIKEKTGI